MFVNSVTYLMFDTGDKVGDDSIVLYLHSYFTLYIIVKLRQGSGKDRQGMALKGKGLKASTLA